MSVGPAVCFCSLAFRDEAIEAIIPRLAELGYDGVEIAAWHLRGKGPDELAALRRLAAQHHVRLALVSPQFWLTRDLPELIDRSFANAAQAVVIGRALAGPEGSPMIRVLLDAGPDRIGSASATSEHWQRAVHALRRITALDPGTVFRLEMHSGTLADTPGSTLRVITEVGARNLAVSFRPGEPDAIEGLPLLRHAVRHVHLPGPEAAGSGEFLEDSGDKLLSLLEGIRSEHNIDTLSVGYRQPGLSWERAASARQWLRANGL